MSHVVLLGDSIFDNAACVGAGPDVVTQLQADLPPRWRATLRTRHGATIATVRGQLRTVPQDASHLVIRFGGNDALRALGVIDERTASMEEALERLALVREQFGRNYAAMLEGVLALNLPTAVCTIYDPCYPDPRRLHLGVTALAALNDVLLRIAFGRGVPIIDLRLICSESTDYANRSSPPRVVARRSRRQSHASYLRTTSPASALKCSAEIPADACMDRQRDGAALRQRPGEHDRLSMRLPKCCHSPDRFPISDEVTLQSREHMQTIWNYRRRSTQVIVGVFARR